MMQAEPILPGIRPRPTVKQRLRERLYDLLGLQAAVERAVGARLEELEDIAEARVLLARLDAGEDEAIPWAAVQSELLAMEDE